MSFKKKMEQEIPQNYNKLADLKRVKHLTQIDSNNNNNNK